jgi:hypothetical protein
LARADGLESCTAVESDCAVANATWERLDRRIAPLKVATVMTAAALAVVVGVAVERLHLLLSSLLVVAFIFSRLVPQITSAQQDILQVAQSLPAFSDLLEKVVRAPIRDGSSALPAQRDAGVGHVWAAVGEASALLAGLRIAAAKMATTTNLPTARAGAMTAGPDPRVISSPPFRSVGDERLPNAGRSGPDPEVFSRA